MEPIYVVVKKIEHLDGVDFECVEAFSTSYSAENFKHKQKPKHNEIISEEYEIHVITLDRI